MGKSQGPLPGSQEVALGEAVCDNGVLEGGEARQEDQNVLACVGSKLLSCFLEGVLHTSSPLVLDFEMASQSLHVGDGVHALGVCDPGHTVAGLCQ